MLAAKRMGCDSADGTFLAYGPDVNLPRLLSWLCEPPGLAAIESPSAPAEQLTLNDLLYETERESK
jgi:hypothetical protein